MKKVFILLFLSLAVVSCVKEENDSDEVCTSNCTTISGSVLTSGGKPVQGVNFELYFIESSYLTYYKSRLKREAKSDAKGFYSMDFKIKEDEVTSFEGNTSSYFDLLMDFNSLDPDKYILPEGVSSTDEITYKKGTTLSLKQDTVYNISMFIPVKKYITVTLKNFKPRQEGDFFKVQTFFPMGLKLDAKEQNVLLNTEYEVSSSGFDTFMAKDEIQTFRNVPVALNDTNLVRIVRKKNGEWSSEDRKIYVSDDRAIELTYEY